MRRARVRPPARAVACVLPHSSVTRTLGIPLETCCPSGRTSPGVRRSSCRPCLHRPRRCSHLARTTEDRNRHGLADRGRRVGVLHAGRLRAAGERHEPRQERDQRHHEELLRHVLRRGRVLGRGLRPDVRCQRQRLDRDRPLPRPCGARGRLRHAVLPDDVRRHRGHHRQRRDRRAHAFLGLHRRVRPHHRAHLSGVRCLGLGLAFLGPGLAARDGLHRLRGVDRRALGGRLVGARRHSGGRAAARPLRVPWRGAARAGPQPDLGRARRLHPVAGLVRIQRRQHRRGHGGHRQDRAQHPCTLR
eukprot:Opistho-2@55851